MAKLNYTNFFIVSTNAETKEVVIGCYQDYNDYSFSKISTEIKGERQRELITEIVMTAQNAKKLKNLLNDSLSKLAHEQNAQPIFKDSSLGN